MEHCREDRISKLLPAALLNQLHFPHRDRSNLCPLRSSMMCYTWYNRARTGTSPAYQAHHNNLENDPTGDLKFGIEKIGSYRISLVMFWLFKIPIW